MNLNDATANLDNNPIYTPSISSPMPPFNPSSMPPIPSVATSQHFCLNEQSRIKLDRNQLTKSTQLYTNNKISSLNFFYAFFKHLVDKIHLLFAFFKKTPPASLDHQILAQLVRTTPLTEKTPLSLLLDYVKGQLAQTEQDNDQPHSLYARLELASKWAKQLDSLIKKSSSKFPHREIASLLTDIKQQLTNLSCNDKLLLTGGYQNEKGESIDALYEIEKKNDRTFTVRVICLDPAYQLHWPGIQDLEKNKTSYQPLLEFSDVAEVDLMTSLEPLLYIQFPAIYRQQEIQNRGFLGERLHAISRLISEDTSSTASSPFTCFTVMTTLFKKSPHPIEHSSSISSSLHSNKTLLTYLKIIDPDHYKKSKIELELSAFFDFINQNNQALFKNKEIRKLLYLTARKLIAELQKNKELLQLSEENFNQMLEDVNSIFTLVQKLDRQTEGFPRIHFTSFEDQLELPTVTQSSNFKEASKSFNDLPTIPFVDLAIPTLSLPLLSINSEELKNSSLHSLNLFKQQLQVAQSLYNQGDYASLEAVALDLARQLPVPKLFNSLPNQLANPSVDFWEGLYLTQNPSGECVLTEWRNGIFELSQLLFDAHQIHAPTMTPEKLIANATLLAIADRLMVLKDTSQNNPQLNVPSVTISGKELIYFDPSDIQKTLTEDRYFRAIPAQQHLKAQEILAYWQGIETASSKPRIKIKLDDWNNLTEQDSRYLAHLCHLNQPAVFNFTRQDILPLFKELEILPNQPSQLPVEVIQQRKMHLMMSGMLSHQKAFAVGSVKDALLIGSQMVTEVEGSVLSLSKKQIQQRLWQICDQKTREKFSTNVPVIKQGQRAHIKWEVNKDRELILQPANTRFDKDLPNDNPIKQTDFYKSQGKYLDEQTDRTVVNFEVSCQNQDVQHLTQQALINQALTEEEKLLRSMQTADSRLEQTVATFLAHPELLDSLSNQRLLELNLFEQGKLFAKLTEQPHFAQELLSFTHNNLKLATSLGNISRALFFMQLQENLKDYVRLSPLSIELKHEMLQQYASPPDYSLLLTKCTTPQDQQRVYTDQLLYFLHHMETNQLNFEPMTEEKFKILRLITTGFFLFKSLKLGEKEQDPTLEKRLEHLLMRVSPYLRTQLTAQKEQNRRLILDDLAQALSISFGSAAITGQFPHLKVGHHEINFTKGLILTKGLAKGLLPQEILNDQSILKLFQDPKTAQFNFGQVYLQFKRDPITQEEIIVYTFENNPNLQLIKKKRAPLVIQMKLYAQPQPGFLAKRTWYEYVPFDRDSKEATDQLPLSVGNLILDNCVWRSVKQPTQLIIRNSSNRLHLYAIQLKANKKSWQIKEVKRFSDGLILMNPWKLRSSLGDLTKIEDPQHINIWAKDKRVKEIEFPRLQQSNGKSLSYSLKTVKQNGVKRLLIEKEGCFVPFESGPLYSQSSLDLPHKKEVELLPHSFEQFHLLVNAKTGAKKVLMPFQQFRPLLIDLEEANKTKQKIWNDCTQLEHACSSWDIQRLFEFEVDVVKNSLTPPTEEAGLYLAYLFFTHKHYEKALDLLKASSTSLPLSPSHRQLYHWIMTWPDQTIESTSFKLQAALALKANLINQPIVSQAEPEDILIEMQTLQELYEPYQMQKNALSSNLKLTEEQLLFYDQLLHQTFLPTFEKKPLATSTFRIAPKEWPSATSLSLPFVAETTATELFLTMVNKSFTVDYTLLTSNDLFLKNFIGLYRALYQAPVQSKEFWRLKQLVELASPPSHTAKGIQRLLRAFIYQKEKAEQEDNPASWQQYLFPVNFKLPYFTLHRLKVLDNLSTPAVMQLKDFLKQLAHLADTFVELSPPSSNQPFNEEGSSSSNTAPVNPPEPDYQFNPANLQIPWESNELPHLAKVKKLLKDPVVGQASPVKILKRLKKAHLLAEMAKNRRLAELHHRRTALDAYLQANQPQPLDATAANPAVPIPSPASSVFHFDPKPFFKVKTVSLSAQQLNEEIEQTTQFFEAALSPAMDLTVQRLAKVYQTDTVCYLKNKKSEEISLKKDVSLTHLKKEIERLVNASCQEKLKAEQALLTLLNQYRPFTSLLAHAQQTLPTRLIGLYAQGELDQVFSFLGLRTPADLNPIVKELTTLIQQWMEFSIQESMSRKALDLTGIALSSNLNAESVAELYQALTPKRFFNLTTHPQARRLLTIEFITGFILRKGQVSTIDSLLEDPTQVKQLGMGEGKSSVILPLLLHLLADGKQLGLGILPEWLYEILAQDLDKSSRALFNQTIFKFEFDRHTNMDEEWLTKQYVTLAAAIQNRDAVITTKTALLSFRNRFLERCQEFNKADRSDLDEQMLLDKNLKLMASILYLFKTRGAVIADEIDTILDIRQELNYALGLPKKIETSKWQLGLRIYDKILFNPKFKSFGDKLRANQQSLLSSAEQQSLQRRLARSFYREWKEQLDENLTVEQFSQYLLDHKEIEDLREGMPEFMHQLKAKPETLALYQEIILLRHYLCKTLPVTLSHAGNVHYGRAVDGMNTVPYKANNTPSQAEFGEQFERIGHFIQDYMQNGLSSVQVQTWVNTLLKRIQDEMHEVLTHTGSLGAYEETPTHLSFKKDFPNLDLVKISQNSLYFNQLMEAINKSDQTKINFLQTWIFPLLTMSSTQLSANAHDLVNLVKSFSGFTGTPWNTDTYHSHIRSDEAQLIGTEGKTVDLLVKLFQEGHLHIHSFKLNPHKPLDSMLQAFPKFLDTYDALIDAGYYLKGVDAPEVLTSLSQQSLGKKTALAYITTKNEKVIQQFNKEELYPLQTRQDIKMEERLTYFDQAHTIGTDIPHAPCAHALVTISEKMYLKDFFQAVWRMRKIDRGQKIDLLISDEIAVLIKAARPSSSLAQSDSLTIQDVILFCIKNQAEREADDNLRAERQRLTGLVPSQMFCQLVESCQDRSIENKHALIDAYQSFLFKDLSTDYDALAKVNQLEDTHQVLERLRGQLIANYTDTKKNLRLRTKEAYFKNQLQEAISALEEHPLLAKEKLPKQIENVAQEAKELQVQVQCQQQQQMSLQSQPAAIPLDPNQRWQPWPASNLKQLWEQATSFTSLKEAIPFLANTIKYTANFVLNSLPDENLSLEDKLLDANRIPVAQVLVIQNRLTQEWQFVLLDIKDYEKVVAPLLQHAANNKFKAAVFDTRSATGSLLLRSTAKEHGNPWNIEENNSILAQLVKIKIFNRQMNFFNQAEVQAIKDWLREDREKSLQTYFEDNLLDSTTKATYLTSTLHRLFKENDFQD